MLSKVLGILGLKMDFGPIAILLGVLFAFGGAATWLREDGISDTNKLWEAKASEAALKAHNEVQAKQLIVERLQKQLNAKEMADDAKRREDEVAVERQKVDYPLSPDCLKCRVPNERIWVRGDRAVAGKPSGNQSKVTAPGS